MSRAARDSRHEGRHATTKAIAATVTRAATPAPATTARIVTVDLSLEALGGAPSAMVHKSPEYVFSQLIFKSQVAC